MHWFYAGRWAILGATFAILHYLFAFVGCEVGSLCQLWSVQEQCSFYIEIRSKYPPTVDIYSNDDFLPSIIWHSNHHSISLTIRFSNHGNDHNTTSINPSRKNSFEIDNFIQQSHQRRGKIRKFQIGYSAQGNKE